MTRDYAGEVGKSQPWGAFISLVKELGPNPKDNGKPSEFSILGNTADLYFRKRSMVLGWKIKNSSRIDWVGG